MSAAYSISCQHGRIVGWSVFAGGDGTHPPVEPCDQCAVRVAAADALLDRALGRWFR